MSDNLQLGLMDSIRECPSHMLLQTTDCKKRDYEPMHCIYWINIEGEDKQQCALYYNGEALLNA